jgi:hypothetical protein
MNAPRVYASFDAAGTKNPAASDLKYYFLLRAWSRRRPLLRAFVDVHATEPGFDPRKTDIRGVLERRLRGSDLLLLILTDRTRASGGWVSWEIDFAGRHCRLPIVCAYPDERAAGHRHWWPDPLHRLAAELPHQVMHVPFRPRSLASAFETASG